MADPVQAPPPPIFNFNAYSPAEIQDAIEKVGVKKANLPFLPSFMLALVAGGAIGLGALYYTIVASDPGLSFATTRVVGGLVFSLGLAIVLVGGAELFTGNNLIVMAWASGKISTREVLRNWLVVYCGNLVGALGARHPCTAFTSSRYERRPHRAVHIEYGGHKDQPRHVHAVHQGHLVQHARLHGGLACVCRSFGHR